MKMGWKGQDPEAEAAAEIEVWDSAGDNEQQGKKRI